jgi:formamidopyrimidine-DNA glycosylase
MNQTAHDFESNLMLKHVVDIERRGKFLIFNFNDNSHMVVHLKLTGQLLFVPAHQAVSEHTYLSIQFANHKQLRYVDLRGFGKIWYFSAGRPLDIDGLINLGIEPFDERLTADYLKTSMENSRRAVKTMLLEQSIVAGIGNIYAAEILYHAGIHPQRACNTLTNAEWVQLATSIRHIMQWAVTLNTQMTPEAYAVHQGLYYYTNSQLQVYGRGMCSCKKCGSQIQKIQLNGRGTYYCPGCQK